MKTAARTALSLTAALISAATLIATSQAPIMAYTEEDAAIDFSLEAGESVTFLAQITHTEHDDATGYVNLSALASAYPLDGETELSIRITEETPDTGPTAEYTGSEVVGPDGVGVSTYASFDLHPEPLITLTADKAGGATGTLTVGVTVEWYTDDIDPAVSVSLIALE